MQVNVLIWPNFAWAQGRQVCSEKDTLVPIFCPEPVVSCLLASEDQGD